MTFRWLTFGRIKKVIGETQAVLITSVFFALVHGNVVVAVYAFIMGLIMALIYRQSKTFSLCVLFHMSANAFVFVSAYVL
jgi:membrane protease YdiL (CAAX protease family)